MASASGDRAAGAPGAAAAFTLALIALVYAGPLLSGERFYFRDVSQNHGPVLEGARALIAAHQAPGWSPWAGGGEPLFANPNHVLFVPEGLFGILLGQGLGLSLAALAGTLLAGLFLFLLLRDLGRSPWAAAAGSLAFALSGYALSIGSLPNVMAAVSWIPAALFFTSRARAGSRWIPAAVIATALVLAPCEPASALVLAVFALALAGWRAAGVLALGAAAAAAQILPAAMWIGASARAQVGLAAADASKWALSLRRLPELVAPGFLGRPEQPLGFWGAPLFDTGLPLILSLHVGGVVLLLAAWGLRGPGTERGTGSGSSRAGVERVLAVLGAAFFLLGLVATPARLGGIIPGASLFRYPEKFVLGTILALAMLAASGMDRLLASSAWTAEGASTRGADAGDAAGAPGWTAWLRGERGAPALIAVSSAALLVFAILAIPRLLSWYSVPMQSRAGSIASHGISSAFVMGAVELALFSAAMILARWARSRASGGPLLASAIGGGLLLGALVPGAGPVPWRLRANPSVPASFYESRPYFEDRLKAVRETGERVFRFDRPAGFAVLNRTGTLADGHQWDRRSLARSSASEFGVALAYDRSTDRLDPAGQDAALEFFKGRPLEEQLRFWSLASVRLVLAFEPLEAPGLRLVDRVDGESNVSLLLYENDRCLPRARMTSTLRSFPASSDEEARARIAAAEGDAWQEPQIEPPEGRHVSPASLVRSHATGTLPPVDTGRKATIVESRPGFLRIRIEAAPGAESAPGGGGVAEHRPENLVVSENDVRGWKATLDGAPVRIARANGMHMSVLIPDVRAHEVILAYGTPGFPAGAAISALALLLAFVRGLRRDVARAAPAGAVPAASAAPTAPPSLRRRGAAR